MSLPTLLNSPSSDVFTFLFSNPFLDPSHPLRNPRSSFACQPTHTPDVDDRGLVLVRDEADPTEGQRALPHPVLPHRPLFVEGSTGASITFSRLRLDSLRIARGLCALLGDPLHLPPPPTTASASQDSSALIDPRSTILLHLPNCLPYAPLLFGALAARFAVSMANPSLSPRELAWIVDQTRPCLILTTKGEGEAAMRAALEMVERAEDGSKEEHGWGRKERRRYVDEMVRMGDRILVVDLDEEYYGPAAESNKGETGRKRGSWATAPPSRSWTTLFANPASSSQKKEAQSSTTSPPVAANDDRRIADAIFSVKPMDREEQDKRVAVVLWSSGTTGKSKGVLLSHRACVAAVAGVYHGNPTYGDDERWVGFAPFYHVYALTNVLLIAPTIGATVIIMRKFNFATYLRYLSTYRITHGHIAPPVAVLLSKSPLVDTSKLDLRSLTGFTAGGAPLSVEAIELVWQRFGRVVSMGYGSTETGGLTTTPGATLKELKEKGMLGSTGVPFKGVEMRIALPDGKFAFPSGGEDEEGTEGGEIQVRVASQMIGYFRNPEADAATFVPGEDGRGDWIRTGDKGRFDEHGNLWITGRLKEMIKVKGFQVSPPELDGLLGSSPLLLDAAVTGYNVPEEGTEAVVAYVVPRDPSALSNTLKAEKLVSQLAEWISSRAVHYKWPRAYVLCESVPKSNSGKIIRKELHHTRGTRYEAPKLRARPKL